MRRGFKNSWHTDIISPFNFISRHFSASNKYERIHGDAGTIYFVTDDNEVLTARGYGVQTKDYSVNGMISYFHYGDSICHDY